METDINFKREALDRSDLEYALSLAATASRAPHTSLRKTTNRTITRRGVLWLGQTCNLHCQFCYFIDKIHSKGHSEHAFMSFEKAKKICKTLVDFYHNNAIDIQGGEPTIYKEIYELIGFCNEIGLKPTLITNALVLDSLDTCRKYKDAGIRDFLVSMHGIGEVYDNLVGKMGAHLRQMRALRNLQEVGVPFRFNCVLSKPVVDQLPLVAELAVKTDALVVNFIAFNPFEDQSRKGRRNTSNVPRYSDVKEKLVEAVDILENAGIETNVRYFPLCMLEERHRKSGYNFQQLPYDHHEWDYASWAWTGLQPQRMREGNPSPPVPISASRWLSQIKRPFKRLSSMPILQPVLYKAHGLLAGMSSFGNIEELYRKIAKIHAEIHCRYTYGDRCSRCQAKSICDGFHGDYAEIFGTEEANPIRMEEMITDPLYYISHQLKFEEKEDDSQALPQDDLYK